MMDRFVLSLFDLTGAMVKPWVAAGYQAVIVDIQHPPGITEGDDGITRIGADLRNGWTPPRAMVGNTAFVSAFPPCDHLAVSGARWFKGKGLRALAQSIDLFATAAELCEWLGAPYLIENPVSTIASYWRKPDAIFHPHQFTLLEPDDNYTKTTCLWIGHGLNLPPPCKDFSLPPPDNRIHRCAPSAERKNFRSVTPAGFARAVFNANSGTAP